MDAGKDPQAASQAGGRPSRRLPHPVGSRASARLRVAFLDHTSEPGGAELALVRVLLEAPDDVDAVVFVPRGEPGVYADPRLTSVSAGSPQLPGASDGRGTYGFIGPVVGVLRQALVLRRHQRFRQSDVVVANTARAAVYGMLACLGTRQTFVVHVRDEVSRDALGPLGFPAMRLALRSAHLVIANSRHTLGLVEPSLRPDTPRRVIPSPTGLAVRPPWTPTPHPVRRIGMVARVDPWKGHELLVRAFRQAFPGPGVELHLAGSTSFGHERHLQALEVLVEELGLSSRVHFAGHVTDVAGFIDDMDVCVQCSLRPEPLGQNVLQYLARRRPVVASRMGGPAEWVTHGQDGLLFLPGDVTSLAASLQTLSADWALREWVMSSGVVRVPDDASLARELFGVLQAGVGRQGGSRRRARRQALLQARVSPAEAAHVATTTSARRPDADRVMLPRQAGPRQVAEHSVGREEGGTR